MSEFDQYASTYRDIINQNSAVTGESFEYFIGVRLSLVQQALARDGRPAPARILDFGCGIGATETQLRERFPQARLDGVDSSRESLNAAESLGLRDATFTFSESDTLPFAEASFDLVYSNGTFHHIPHEKHPKVLAELARVLKPGGDLFIFENNPLNPLTVRGMRNNPFDRGTKMVFPWSLRARVAAAGLRATTPYFYVFFPRPLKALRWTEPHLRHVPIGAQYYVRGTRAL